MSEQKFRTSCDGCLSSKVKCTQVKPACRRCVQNCQECIYSRYRKIGRPSYRSQGLQQQQAQRKSRKKKKQQQQQQQSFDVQPQEQQQGMPHHQTQSNKDMADSHSVDDAYLPNMPIGRADPPDLGLANLTDWHEADAAPENPHFDGDDLDMSVMQETDWADLINGFDMTATPPISPSQIVLQPSMPSPYPHAVATNENTSKSASNSRRRSVADFPVVSLPFSLSSSGAGQVPSTTTALPLHCSRSSPATPPAVEHLSCRHAVHSRDFFTSSQPVTSAVGRRSPNNASHMEFFRRRRGFTGSPLQSFDSRCNLQCHVILTDQLNSISERLADRCKARLTLDVLLNFDRYVREEREKSLRCPVCLDKSRRSQTLMLITMVISKLLALFELECHADQCPTGSEFSTLDAFGILAPGGALFLKATLPLVVGQIQLHDDVQAAFSRQLLRMYLEAQNTTAAQLRRFITEADGSDIVYKATGEVLADVSRRAHCLLGMLKLTEGSDSAPLVRPVLS